MSATLDALNTAAEVAEFAKVSERTVKRAIAAGSLDALRCGAQLRITEDAVWRWLGAPHSNGGDDHAVRGGLLDRPVTPTERGSA